MSFAGRTRDLMSGAAPEPIDRTVVNSFVSGTKSESGAGGVTGRNGIAASPRPSPLPLPVMVNVVLFQVDVEVE